MLGFIFQHHGLHMGFGTAIAPPGGETGDRGKAAFPRDWWGSVAALPSGGNIGETAKQLVGFM